MTPAISHVAEQELNFWRAKAAVCQALSNTLVENPERARQALTSRASGADKPCFICPGLYLGSWQTESDSTCLKLHGITHILQVGRELFPSHADVFVYKHIPVYDMEAQDIVVHLRDCFNCIDEAREKGGILVHCAAGVSRSATVVIAYVMAQRCCSYDTALAVVRASRSIVNPNKGFVLQLQEWERMEWDWDSWPGWDLERFMRVRQELGIGVCSPWRADVQCKAAPRLLGSKRSSLAGELGGDASERPPLCLLENDKGEHDDLHTDNGVVCEKDGGLAYKVAPVCRADQTVCMAAELQVVDARRSTSSDREENGVIENIEGDCFVGCFPTGLAPVAEVVGEAPVINAPSQKSPSPRATAAIPRITKEDVLVGH